MHPLLKTNLICFTIISINFGKHVQSSKSKYFVRLSTYNMHGRFTSERKYWLLVINPTYYGVN